MSATHPSASRHAIRGPHGRFIRPDEYDRYVRDEERRIANLIAPRSENEAPDLRPMTAPKHFIPTMEPVPSKSGIREMLRLTAVTVGGLAVVLILAGLCKIAGF